MAHTSLKDGIKPSGKGSTQENINISPKPNEKKPERKAQAKSQMRIDIDGTLTGKRVMLYVQIGNTAGTIIGTIITMGSFWVVVKVEKSNIPHIRDIIYVNKAYIIMYIPWSEGEQK